jgi:SAM-dependent methyltransferase
MSYFDHFAQSRGTVLGNRLSRRAVSRQFAHIQRLLPSTDSAILEIGSGQGDLADLFYQAGYHDYTVVEPNALMRDALAQRGFKTKNYLIPRLDEVNCSYDALVLFDVFEHLNDTSAAMTFIAEAARVLRPAGLLCILSPDYLHWRADFFNCDFSHSNVTSVRRTLQLFHNQRLKMLEYAYFSSFLEGLPATVLSYAGRAGLMFANSNGMDRRLYKLKLSCLRRFLIIGRKDHERADDLGEPTDAMRT